MQYQYQYHHQISIMDQKGWVQASSAEIMSPNCPRCGSSNTKFCYYNNYSLTQPRYFCKGCRRYWTKGGNLRNVPVGGGCRKNRRPTKSSSSSLRLHSSTTKLLSHLSSNNNNRAASASSDLLASDSATASHIDLAVVYANFLNNPQPPESTHKVISKADGSDDNNIIVGVLEEDSSSIIPSSPNNIHHQQPSGNNNNNSIGFFGWDSLSDLFADTSDHLKVTDESISRQIYDMHHHPAIQQSSTSIANNVNTGGYFELPPLPGEELVVIGCREITMEAARWSDSGRHHHQLLLDHDDHSLTATELLPIMINGPPDNNEAPAPAPAAAPDEDSHHLNLIGANNNSKDFDFDHIGDHDTFLSN